MWNQLGINSGCCCKFSKSGSAARWDLTLSRFMLRKLYSTVSGANCADNPDSPQHQEVLLPGSLYGMIIKERMEEILNNIRGAISADVRNGVVVDFNDSKNLHSPPNLINNFKFQNVTLPRFCLRSTLISAQSWQTSWRLAI